MAADDPDLNLLAALDVLLEEASVTAAARRLGLSVSAMSRTLTRLRAVTGDALLVRAGRRLVPTPHASALAARVAEVHRAARAVLSAAPEGFDPARLRREVCLRVSEVFLDTLAPFVTEALLASAPELRVRFVLRADRDAAPLREEQADLEIGLPGGSGPEIRLTTLFEDRYVGVARCGHALLAEGAPDAAGYAGCRHVAVASSGAAGQMLDDGLAALGLARRVAAIVPGYPAAMRLAASGDLVAMVPRSALGHRQAPGLVAFALPVPLPGFRVCAMWHPRRQADPVHRWLRAQVISACREACVD
ncbi:DNA-binding transcriptional LysR family regulator [Endobacter medicaginis]|uniref:DNA-binding transcriptional LysR family regulator n=3 Tax=Endobacter medicaginis TaxID=1181271 RepID=A0A839V1G1_9PROT|nr:LysR family transcriptional regulator [Endobacter medicaginis]MBB3174685.1 DNA-binding transcriptional LysR family regulator [Endobacter medicaginis]MCX5474920.1 LysR family transcriptional regulator [Endobacter medicaginis]